MKVIVNVDDYCLTKSQIDGTIYAYKNGVVSSTTCMANMPDELLEYGAFQANENPGLGIGCHLNLTCGQSLTNGKSFTNPDGSFKKNGVLDLYALNPDEVYIEFKAQIDRFIKFFKRKPTHLDSHHNEYTIQDACGIKEVVERLLNEYQIEGGRLHHPRVRSVGSPYNNFTYETFTKKILDQKELGVTFIEIGCHVAFVDQELYEKSSYNYQRLIELKVLTSKEILDFYSSNNIEKAHY